MAAILDERSRFALYQHNLHRLTVKHMQALIALDREATVSRAALSLGISQPAMSSRLQEIERLYRSRFFQRVGNRMVFTQAGQILLNATRLMLEELKRAEIYLDRLEGQPAETIRLEIRGYLLDRYLAPVLARFMAAHPDTVVEVSSSFHSIPFENLLGGKVDVVLLMGEFIRARVERYWHRSDDLVGVLPPDHPLARRTHLEAKDFVPETLLVSSAQLERGQEVERFFEPAGLSTERVVALGHPRMVCAMVAQKAGLGILGRWAAADSIRDYGLATVPLTDKGIPIQLHAACRSGERAGRPSVAALIEALQSGSGDHPASGPGLTPAR
ncbi:MAG: LysR family transcriptional regulator [Roseovarius sp.]